jgi:hypothetical protein
MLDLQHQYNNCTTIPHMRVDLTYWSPPSCEELLYSCCIDVVQESNLISFIEHGPSTTISQASDKSRKSQLTNIQTIFVQRGQWLNGNSCCRLNEKNEIFDLVFSSVCYLVWYAYWCVPFLLPTQMTWFVPSVYRSYSHIWVLPSQVDGDLRVHLDICLSSLKWVEIKGSCPCGRLSLATI